MGRKPGLRFQTTKKKEGFMESDLSKSAAQAATGEPGAAIAPPPRAVWVAGIVLAVVGAAAFAVQPDVAIAVDVTHGKTPDGPSDGVFELGSGPAIGMGPNLHRGLTKMLIKTAKANDIDYSLEVMEGNTGTNAWTMQIVAHGIATALLSIPEKYMHTPVEVVKTSDVEDVAELMYRFLCDFDGEEEA